MSWLLTHYRGRISTVDSTKPVCVVLSGWSLQTDVFEVILPGLSAYFDLYQADVKDYNAFKDITHMAQALSVLLDKDIKQPYWLMGWSMGGNVAIEIAKTFPNSVSGLFLMSVNPDFIASNDWPWGVEERKLVELCQTLKNNKIKALRQFDILQSLGDIRQKTLVSAFSEYRKIPGNNEISGLSRGLEILRTVKQHSLIERINVPVLWLLGGKDALIPVTVAQQIKRLMSNVSLHIFNASAHAIFLSSPDKFFQHIKYFADKALYQEEKLKIAKGFSRAAETYDDFSGLQKWVGQKLIGKLSNSNHRYPCLLDAGCGTGYWIEELMPLTNYLVGMDLADGMLKYSKKHHENAAVWIGGDIECLPFSNEVFDAIYSNLAVQWSHSFSGMLNSWYNTLSNGGEVFISTLGSGSLCELEASFQTIDRFHHINAFLSLDDIQQSIALTEFEVVSIEQVREIIYYDEPIQLFRDLKGIGASLINRESGKGLMGKDKLQALLSAYEQYRCHDQKIPATYEVIYIHLKK